MCEGWDTINNYSYAVNGRIWVVWNPRKIRVSMVAEHEQALHFEMHDVYVGHTQQVIAAYGLNTSEQRKELWSFLKMQCQ